MGTYDYAYVYAWRGNWPDALARADPAIATLDDDTEGVTFLLVAVPVPDDWSPPDPHWTAVTLRGGWVRPFVTLQAAVVRAQAEPADTETLRVAIADIRPSSPVPLLRLAGWAALALIDDADRAVEPFDAALANSRFDDIELPRLESEYARHAAEARAADAG